MEFNEADIKAYRKGKQLEKYIKHLEQFRISDGELKFYYTGLVFASTSFAGAGIYIGSPLITATGIITGILYGKGLLNQYRRPPSQSNELEVRKSDYDNLPDKYHTLDKLLNPKKELEKTPKEENLIKKTLTTILG